MLPGTRALAFVSRWFDSQTVATVFEPLIADWQREWHDAAGPRRMGVWTRGAGALLVSMIAVSPSVMFAPWPAGTLRRVVRRVTIWTTLASGVLMVPFVTDLGRKIDIEVVPYLVILLLPQALAVAFPLAVTTIVDVIRSAPRPTREERIAATKFAFVATTLMLMLAGWGYPAANRQFRIDSTLVTTGRPRPIFTGLREMSIVELANDASLKSALWRDGRESWATGRAETIRGEIASRTALVMLPLVLMWIRWRALLLPRGHWYSALPLIISAPLTFSVSMFLLYQEHTLADIFYAPRWTGPLLAWTVLAIASASVDRTRRHFGRIA